MNEHVQDPQETTEVAVRASAPLPDEPESMIGAIERIARDPSISVDRIKQLIDLQRQLVQERRREAFDAAFAAMQPELPTITERGGIKDRAGKIQSTYAKWPDINEAIRPVLATHGFSLRHRVRQTDGLFIVTGILSHVQGHREETDLVLPLDTSGSKNAVQAVGSTTSYGQRYTTKVLLNITSRAPEDRDDDGQAAGIGGALSDGQLLELRELMDGCGADVQKFCHAMGVDGLALIPVGRFDEATRRVREYAAKRQQMAARP